MAGGSVTLGAYPFYRPGQWFTARSALQKRFGRVFFAGESSVWFLFTWLQALGPVEAGKYAGAIVRMTLFQQMDGWIILSGREFPFLPCASEVTVAPFVWLW